MTLPKQVKEYKWSNLTYVAYATKLSVFILSMIFSLALISSFSWLNLAKLQGYDKRQVHLSLARCYGDGYVCCGGENFIQHLTELSTHQRIWLFPSVALPPSALFVHDVQLMTICSTSFTRELLLPSVYPNDAIKLGGEKISYFILTHKCLWLARMCLNQPLGGSLNDEIWVFH